MIKIKIKYIAMIIVFVLFIENAEIAFASVKGIDDEYFKFYASYEDDEFKADNVGDADKKWSTKEKQKQGDWFIIDMLENKQVGQIVFKQNKNNYPGKYNVYAAAKRENLKTPVISGANGSEEAILTVDFPSVVSCRFIKIELAEGTEQNENPWEINSLEIMSSNEALRKVKGYEVIKSGESKKQTETETVLKKIGINFNSYDGTRESFAKILTEFYGMGTVPAETSEFRDVKTSDKNYDYIITMGSICGIKDKMFYPEREITVIETLRYILDAMGYKIKISAQGGYPIGYKNQAVKLGIISSKTDCEAKADKIILENIIYKALFSPILKQLTYGDDAEFAATEELTCALYWHNLKKIEGILISTDISSITGKSLVNKKRVMIDDTVYICKTNAEELLGCAVKGYVSESRGSEDEIVFISENTDKNRSLKIPADNIEGFSDNRLRYLNNYPYSNKIQSADIDKKADMIYNFKAKVPFDASVFNLKNGYVNLIDNDNDGVYEVVSVCEYINYVVSYKDSSNMILSDYYGKPSIKLDESEVNYRITNGESDMKFDDIAEGDVVSVMADGVIRNFGIAETDMAASTILRLVVSKNQIIGEVTGVNSLKNIIYIDGREWFFDKDYISLAERGTAIIPEIGMRYEFRTDGENKICDVRYAKESDMAYALIVGAESDKNGLSENVYLKLLTTEGVQKTYPVYKKVMIDGVKSANEFSASKTKELFWEDLALEKIDEATGATISYTQNQLVPQVIGYRLNEAGEISYIDTKEFNSETENSQTSICRIATARYTCNSYRGMIYPTELNDNPNLNYTGGVNPIIFVGPDDISSADVKNDYSVHGSEYLRHDEKYDLEIFKKSEFNDLEIVYIHSKGSDENARYKYVLVDEICREMSPEGVVKQKLYGIKYGEKYEAFFTGDSVLQNAGFVPQRGDLVIAETVMSGEIATISRLVNAKNPSLTLRKNDKYYSGERITIGQVYNASDKNIMVTSTKKVSDPGVQNSLELFMFPATAAVYDEEANEVRTAKISDVLAYKKTNSEKKTSVIYACTTWGLHQSFIIYNFKDYIPGE